jgi:hypothetical protein
MRQLVQIVALLVALLAGSSATALAQQATPKAGNGGTNAVGDPLVGSTVPYIGSDGKEIAKVTVEDFTDPFEDYDPSSAPERGDRFVSIHVTIDNTGTRSLDYSTSDYLLQDDQGFLYGSTFITRDESTEKKDPDLESDTLAAGDTVSGFLAFEVLTDANLVRLYYSPESSRLITLADLRES